MAHTTTCLRLLYCVSAMLFFAAQVCGQMTLQPRFVPLPGSRNYDDIRTILPDSKGFLWFGCNQGLVRFDGNTYHRFEPGNGSKTISSDAVTALHEDINGTIWVGTADKGLYSYRHSADTFTHYSLATPAPNIISIDKYNDGIVVSAGNNIFLLDGQNKTRKLHLPDSLLKNNFIVIKTVQDATAKKDLWMLALQGLYSYDDNTGEIKKWHSYGFSVDEVGNMLTTLAATADGKIYCATKNKGLIELDIATGAIVNYSFSKNPTAAYTSNNIDALFDYGDGNLFAATQDSGVAVFSKASNRFSFLKESSFSETNAYRFQAKAFAANRQNLVMATQHDGIWVFNKASHLFAVQEVTSKYNKVPGQLYTRSIYPAPNNKVYAGSYFGDGLYLVNNGFLQSYPFLQSNAKDGTLIINAIFRDHNNVIWLASHKNGILIFDEAKQKIIPLTDVYPALKSAVAKKIYCFHEDKQHNLYVATGDAGLLKMDATRQRFVNYLHSGNDSATILTNNLFAEKIFEDNKGRLWLSTREGVTVLETASQKFYHFTSHQDKFNSLPASFWYSFQQDDKGFIYIGTGDGIYKIDNEAKSLANAKHFTEKDGLQHNSVFSFVKDKQGMIWVTCRSGLSCFNPSTNGFINFNYKNGLPSKTLMAPMQLAADGIIYHGAVEKYFSFNPVKLLAKYDTLKVWLTAFKIFDKDSIKGFMLNNVKGLQLAYNQNSFSFSYVSPSIYYPDAVEYAYMLEGFDKEWQFPGNRNYVSYTNVNPGTYTFKVKATGASAVWCSAVTAVTIVVAPPFWGTWWFRLLVALAVAGLVYALIKYREKAIAKKEAQKTEMEKLKALGYQYQLEIEQVTNFFGSTINRQNSIDGMLWGIAKNLIGELGFEECMIYLWNNDKTMLVQHAGYGLKGDMQIAQDKEGYHIQKGKGIVGAAANKGEYVLVNDTSKDNRYFSADEKIMFSELAVPIMQNDQVIGVINTEHCKKNFFSGKHVKILSVIASLCADKMEKINAEKQAREKEMEVLKLSKDISDWQLSALRAQMNPHFIFNALNSIQQFTLQNDSDNANLYLSKFSSLLRKVLHTSQQNFISLEEEVQQLGLYLEIEKLRMGNDFVFDIIVGEEIETDALKLPGMLVQPFVENAIKHGLPLKQGEKRLGIHFSMPDEWHLKVIVEDNGIGRQQAEELKRQQTLLRHESKGIALVKQRLQLLEQGNQHHAGVFIDDKSNNAGTLVTLIIPVL